MGWNHSSSWLESLVYFILLMPSPGLLVSFFCFIELCWWQKEGRVLELPSCIIICAPLPPRKLGWERGKLQVGTASYLLTIMRTGGLWSAPRYWPVFPHFFVSKIYLFIYQFDLCQADTVSYLKVTRMEPFGQSPMVQLCWGHAVLLDCSTLKTS